MKILVVGCGSIGRRHIHNLVEFSTVKRIFVYTKSKACFDALDNRSEKIAPAVNIEGVDVDFAVICNETYKHLDVSIPLAKRGISLFIEKPLSHNLVNTNKLKSIAVTNKISIALGYNFRFLKVMGLIKERLKKAEIGDLYFARLEVGQYLPDWRKNRDYRNCYSASSKRGGGVSLDLSHEIDYMRYLFGDPVEYKFIKTKVSSLEIDSDDVFEGIYRYKDNFLCSMHMDYLQHGKKRQMFILGSKGSLTCDFVKMHLVIQRSGKKDKVISGMKYFDLNKTYIDEMKDFIGTLKGGSLPRCSINDGIKAIELIQ